MDELILDQNTTQLRLTQGKPNILLVYRGETTGRGDDSKFTLPNLPVAQTLSALRLVSNIDNMYNYSEPTLKDSVWSIAGLTKQAIVLGQNCTPIRDETVTDISWNWIKGAPIFLGVNGTLTQTPPLTDYLVVVARVLSPQTLFIQIEEPINL
jgi:hypothetical protein